MDNTVQQTNIQTSEMDIEIQKITNQIQTIDASIEFFLNQCSLQGHPIYSCGAKEWINQIKENIEDMESKYNSLELQYGEFDNYDSNKHRFTNIVDSTIFGNSQVNLLHASGELLTVSGEQPSTLVGANQSTKTNSSLTGARCAIGDNIWMATQQPLGRTESSQPTTDNFLEEGFLYGKNGDSYLVINLNNLCHARNYIEEPSTIFKITPFKKLNINADFTIEYFHLKKISNSDYRIMILIHYTEWPDFGIPKSPENFCLMFSMIIQLLSTVKLIMVHCRAGVGRTGTLFTIAKCHEVLLQNRRPDLIKIIKELRHIRPLMVQKWEQLLFIVQCLDFYINN